MTQTEFNRPAERAAYYPVRQWLVRSVSLLLTKGYGPASTQNQTWGEQT